MVLHPSIFPAPWTFTPPTRCPTLHTQTLSAGRSYLSKVRPAPLIHLFPPPSLARAAACCAPPLGWMQFGSSTSNHPHLGPSPSRPAGLSIRLAANRVQGLTVMWQTPAPVCEAVKAEAIQLHLIMASFGSRGSCGGVDGCRCGVWGFAVHACAAHALSPWNPTIPSNAAAADDGQTGWKLTRNAFCQLTAPSPPPAHMTIAVWVRRTWLNEKKKKGNH